VNILQRLSSKFYYCVSHNVFVFANNIYVVSEKPESLSSLSSLITWCIYYSVVVALINGVLGPYMAYPHVLKKGLKAFQKGDEENKNK